jgi:predicted TIM-barrel fold metal-dependent hydrolase
VTDPFQYRWVDADNHYYETDDAFTRHIEPKYKDRAIHVRRDEAGVGQLWFGDTPTKHFTKPPSEALALPGSASGAFEGKASNAEMYSKEVVGHVPEFEYREPRLEVMDTFNLEAAILFPTMGLTVDHEMRVDPGACVANFRAFNSWLGEHWGFAHENRLFAAALLSLVDVEAAVAEVDRVLAMGARVFHVTPGPVLGHSLGEPLFDPVWARIAEAGGLLSFHVCNAGYLRFQGPAWGIPGDLGNWGGTAFSRFLVYRDRPISDSIAALILQNVFGRHPGLRVLSAENGAHWVPWTLGHMDRMHNAVGSYETFGDPSPDVKPSDVFREHVYVAPWSQEDIPELIDLIGPDHVLFGSDFPHPEGLTAPKEIMSAISSLPDDIAQKVLRDNCRSLLHI